MAEAGRALSDRRQRRAWRATTSTRRAATSRPLSDRELADARAVEDDGVGRSRCTASTTAPATPARGTAPSWSGSARERAGRAARLAAPRASARPGSGRDVFAPPFNRFEAEPVRPAGGALRRRLRRPGERRRCSATTAPRCGAARPIYMPAYAPFYGRADSRGGRRRARRRGAGGALDPDRAALVVGGRRRLVGPQAAGAAKLAGHARPWDEL